MQRTGKSRVFALLGCTLLAASLLQLPVMAQPQPSLIESALDGKLNEPAPAGAEPAMRPAIPAGKPGSATAGAKNSPAAAGAKNSPAAAGAKNSSASAGTKNTAPVTHAPPVEPDLDKIPEPAGLDSPIHSMIPYHQPKLPLFEVNLGSMKIDKSFAIDPSYRGRPTLPVVPTVTFGKPSWAIPNKKQLAAGTNSASTTPLFVNPLGDKPAPLTFIPGSARPAPAKLNTIPGTGKTSSQANTPLLPTSSGQGASAQTLPAQGNASPSPSAGDQGPAALPPQARTTASPASGAQQPPAPAKVEQSYELNVRILTNFNFSKTDKLWAYPYPPKPPKHVVHNPLPESEGEIRNMLISVGYTARPDPTRPYPLFGWRWMKAMENGMAKAKTGYAHTMITMYPWANKVFPYVQAECRELNLVEAQRTERYQRLVGEYDSSHIDIESRATARGLVPVEIKVNSRGVAQTNLPAGNWWVTCTRTYPGLKFYWMVPLTCGGDNHIVNLQLNEANALIVAGGW